MTRYLQALPQGVTTCLSGPLQTPAQQVFVQLVQAPASVVLNPRSLAEEWGLSVKQLADALFELSREKSIDVVEALVPQVYAERFTLEDLRDDLRQLVPAQGKLILADAQGLCVASFGLGAAEADRQAALCAQGAQQSAQGAQQVAQDAGCMLPNAYALYLSRHALYVYASHAIDTHKEALLRTVRRLALLWRSTPVVVGLHSQNH